DLRTRIERRMNEPELILQILLAQPLQPRRHLVEARRFQNPVDRSAARIVDARGSDAGREVRTILDLQREPLELQERPAERTLFTEQERRGDRLEMNGTIGPVAQQM